MIVIFQWNIYFVRYCNKHVNCVRHTIMVARAHRIRPDRRSSDDAIQPYPRVQHAVQACALHRVGEAAVRSHVRKDGRVHALWRPGYRPISFHGPGINGFKLVSKFRLLLLSIFLTCRSWYRECCFLVVAFLYFFLFYGIKKPKRYC